MSDLVPQAVRDLLAFYTENYPEIRFGDLDIRVLERAVASIDEAAKEVITAEEAVAIARTKFRGVEAEILSKAGRTLSFLKIFVDDDQTQLAQLEVIGQGLPAGRRRAKATGDAAVNPGEPRQRRTRKNKNVPEVAAETGTDATPPIEATDDATENPVAEPQELESSTATDVVPAAKRPGAKSSGK